MTFPPRQQIPNAIFSLQTHHTATYTAQRIQFIISPATSLEPRILQMNNLPKHHKAAGLLPPPAGPIPIQKMAKKGYIVKQQAKGKANAKAKVKAKAKAKANANVGAKVKRRYRPGERALREIRQMQRTVKPAIPNAPFYRLVRFLFFSAVIFPDINFGGCKS